MKADTEQDAKVACVSPEDDAWGNVPAFGLLHKLCRLVWLPWSRHKAPDAMCHSSELAFLCLPNFYVQENSGEFVPLWKNVFRGLQSGKG